MNSLDTISWLLFKICGLFQFLYIFQKTIFECLLYPWEEAPAEKKVGKHAKEEEAEEAAEAEQAE